MKLALDVVFLPSERNRSNIKLSEEIESDNDPEDETEKQEIEIPEIEMEEEAEIEERNKLRFDDEEFCFTGITNLADPLTYDEAMNSEKPEILEKAINEELQVLKENNT